MFRLFLFLQAFLLHLTISSFVHATDENVDFETLDASVQGLLTSKDDDTEDSIEKRKYEAKELLWSAMKECQASSDESTQGMAPLLFLESQTLNYEKREAEEQASISSKVKPVDLSVLDTLKKDSDPVFCILSVDGGGIRGIIPALYLTWIEEKTGKPICDLFDAFAGTSVGGILALGMNCPDNTPETTKKPKFSAKEFFKLFDEEGKSIFPPISNWNIFFKLLNKIGTTFCYSEFSPKPLEKILENRFKHAELSHSIKPLYITAIDTTGDNCGSEAFVFETDEAKTSKVENYYFKDIARATSAASTYFPAANIQPKSGGASKYFVDAGLTVNNPAKIAYNKFKGGNLCKQNPNKKVVIFSFGTGRPKDMKNIPHGSKNALLNKPLGSAFLAKPLIENMMIMSSDDTDYDMQQTMTYSKDHYIRIQLDLDKEVDLSDVSSDNIEYLKKQAERSKINIVKIADFLNANYQKLNP